MCFDVDVILNSEPDNYFGQLPLGAVGRGGGGVVFPIMAIRRRLCLIPNRRASYPIARCSCQNVIGGSNRQHVRWQRANND